MDMSNNSLWVNETNKAWERSFARARGWGGGLTGYWGLLVLYATIDNWSARLYPRATLVIKSRFTRYSPARFLSRHLTIPPLLPRGKHLAFNMLGGIIPTRLESLVLFIYFALTFIGSSVSYETSKHNVYWPTKSEQLTRHVGDRTGIIAMFIIIPTYLFAGRNNFLLWLTGWKQSTFLTFHRWLARMAVVCSLVHTFTMLLNDYWLDTVHQRKTQQYWRWGSVAMIIGVVMIVQSFPFLRHNWYEIFLYGHIILAVFFLIGLWIHVVPLHGCGPYAYAIAAIWVFDRCARLFKLACFGVREATVSIVDSKHLLVVIDDDTQIWNREKPKPGSYGYLYFLSDYFSWMQSHPFSIITIENRNAIAFYIAVKRGLTGKLYKDLSSNPNKTKKIKILLEGFYGGYKPVEGYDHVIMFASGSGAVSPVEYLKEIADRYNSSVDHHNIKYIKFYWMIPELSHARALSQQLSKVQELECVHLIIYVTREQRHGQLEYGLSHGFIDGKGKNDVIERSVEVGKDDAMDKGKNDVMERSVEVKKDNKGKNDIMERSVEVEKDDATEETRSEFSQEQELMIRASAKAREFQLPYWSDIRYGGRPDLRQLLKDDLKEIQSSDHVAVLTCGHPVLCDQIRNAIAAESSGRTGALDLIELLQTW